MGTGAKQNKQTNKQTNGKTVIEDSHGYTYSYQKSSKANAPLFISRFTYWQCIKRQYKGKNNCKSYLKIEKIEEGSRNMIVNRQGGHDQSRSHNHIPDFAHQLKKDLNEELKNLAINNVNRQTSDIVDTVLQENKDFKTFFE